MASRCPTWGPPPAVTGFVSVLIPDAAADQCLASAHVDRALGGEGDAVHQGHGASLHRR